MARFHREAQVLASLNHQHIAALHGLEDEGGVRALVMGLVDGVTLAERIRRVPMPLEEALGVARQIATRSSFAHERGIIHRDLKPQHQAHARWRESAPETLAAVIFKEPGITTT